MASLASRLAPLVRAEARITTADTAGIVQRWRWGRQLLGDPRLTTPAGHLRHGVAAALRSAAGISEREVQYRLECARAYPDEAGIRTAACGFRGWDALRQAGFPPASGGSEDAPRLALVEASGAVVDQAGAFVQTSLGISVDGGRPVRVDGRLTIREYHGQIGGWLERHRRHGEAINRHLQAVERLLDAADGDDLLTVADAAARLRALPGGGGPPALPAA